MNDHTPAHEVFAVKLHARLLDLGYKTSYIAIRNEKTGWNVELRKTALVGVRVMQSPRNGDLVFGVYTSHLDNGCIESRKMLRWYSALHMEQMLPNIRREFNEALGITALSREESNPFSLKGR